MADTISEANDVKKREIFGWAMYDFANSSYTTVVITAVYSTFFTATIVPASEKYRDSYWSIAMAASAILAIMLSPLVGAICDYSGNKKRYLLIATLCCTISTALLNFVNPGDIWLGIALVMISNAAFMIGESFCGSFLTDLSTKSNMGLISGFGWGLGYFGGIASLAAVQLIVTKQEHFSSYIESNKSAMVFVALFYLVSSLFTFILVKERAKPKVGFEKASVGRFFVQGIKELWQTAELVRKNKSLFKFFAAFTIYMAGLEVIIKFIGIYSRKELSLEMSDIIILFLIIQISAAIGAVLFGVVERYIGAKRTVLVAIVWWIVGILGIYFLDELASVLGEAKRTLFFVIAVIAGSGIGSIQSSSRAVVGVLSPVGRSAQMFGFWGMFSRIAIILGMLFGPLADFLKSRHHAILLVLGFFIVGGIVLFFVDIKESEEASVIENGNVD